MLSVSTRNGRNHSQSCPDHNVTQSSIVCGLLGSLERTSMGKTHGPSPAVTGSTTSTVHITKWLKAGYWVTCGSDIAQTAKTGFMKQKPCKTGTTCHLYKNWLHKLNHPHTVRAVNWCACANIRLYFTDWSSQMHHMGFFVLLANDTWQ